MAENVDEGNENDFKENDNVNQESEILRRNRPFIEYFKQEAKILREQGKKVDRIKLGKCFKNLSEEEKAKFRMVDDFVKGTQKAMETRCAPDRFAKLVAKFLLHIKCGRLKRDLCSWLVQNFDPFTSCIFLHGKSINLSPRDFEYIMGIKDGGVDIDVDLGIDNIDKLRDEYLDDSGYIKLKTLESKLVNQREVNDDFKRSFVLFAIATIIFPKLGLNLAPYYLVFLKDTSAINKKNWATWAFKGLVEGIQKFKAGQHKVVNGCVLFLELFYMDSISFARKFIDKSLSPITTWTNRDVTNFLSFVKKNGETFDGTSRKNEECIHNCQHQKELSLVRKDIGRMTLELDGLKHSMGNWMQQMQQQQKENNGTAVGITSPSRKQQKNDESSHEILTFAELMKRAKERPDGDDIVEKKLWDEEIVEEKYDERILTGESDLNEGKRTQIFCNAAIQDNGRNEDCSVEEESSNQLTVFEIKDMRSRKRSKQKNFHDSITLLNSFSEEDMKLLQYIFQGELPMDDHIVDGISFFVSRQEMFSLAPNTWIIDTVIDCFVNYLTNKERAKTSLEMRIWYLPTIFSQKIVANMACNKKSSIEDFIYVPINDGSAHWYLAVLIVKTQTVEIWDSLHSNTSNSHREEIVRAILQGLDEVFLDDFLGKFHSCWDFFSFKISYLDNVPVQPNGTDCGLFVIKFMEMQCDLLSIKHYNSTIERYRIALHLVNGDTNKVRDSIRCKAEEFYDSHKNNLPPNKVTNKVNGQKNLKKKK
ncbi:hypothetical protein KPL71_008049 [Citrus sinensis]|uniref:Uncharacterized protein n=1 Tax=Citrus sinensis TaxID=2711 RepID=A0ACB8M4F2_CITSI|nr:hypothetical protein KPL71_008049 [Citrus sinensis]